MCIGGTLFTRCKMKIRHIVGDLLSVTSGMIVHGCNEEGKMGKGVALSIRKKYESVYYYYLMLKATEGLCIGNVQYVRVDHNLRIVNAIIQRAYGHGRHERYVDYEAVYACFLKIFNRAKIEKVFTISIPKIGAGLGGGDFGKVLDKIKNAAVDTKYEGSLNIYTLEDNV